MTVAISQFNRVPRNKYRQPLVILIFLRSTERPNHETAREDAERLHPGAGPQNNG